MWKRPDTAARMANQQVINGYIKLILFIGRTIDGQKVRKIDLLNTAPIWLRPLSKK
jgi:hypothetical protein